MAQRNFAYTASVTFAATVNDKQTDTVTIDGSWDFVWLETMYSTTLAAIQLGTDNFHGGALLEIKGPKDFHTKEATPISHLAGLHGVGGGQPRRLGFLERFASNGSIVFTFTNQVASAYTLFLTMIGVHVTPGSPLER